MSRAIELKLVARGIRSTATGPIVVLALAGATFAVAIGFSFVRTVLLSPLPYPSADRIAIVFSSQSPGSTTSYTSSSWDHYVAWRDRSDAFERLTAQLGFPFHLIGESGVEQIGGLRVTEGYFELLGADAGHGRLFTSEDYRDEAPHTVVLSHATWQQRFGADPGVIGRSIRLEDLNLATANPAAATNEYTVVGITGPRFWTPRFWNDAYRTAELWVPLRPGSDLGDTGMGVLDIVGRLAPTAGPVAAQEQLRALETAAPDYDPADPPGTRVISAPEQITGSARSGLGTVLVASALLLAVTCFNTGILLRARVLRRKVLFQTLSALGAPTGRLAGLVATEAFLLTAVGTFLGVLLAKLAMPLVVASLPAGLPRTGDLELGAVDVAVAVLSTLATVVLFGVIPASGVVRSSTRYGAPRGTRSPDGGRSLLVAQVALGAVLLVGTVSAARALAELHVRQLGFATENTLVFGLGPPPARYPDGASRLLLSEQLLRELRRLPGVAASELARNLPLDLAWSAELASTGLAERRDVRVGKRNAVSAGYHEALGIAILAGRTVATTDTAAAEPVVVLNQTAAQGLFDEADAVGRRVSVNGTERTVIGIVADTAGQGLGPTVATAYLPFAQVAPGRFQVVVRIGNTDAAAVLSSIRQAVARVDPQLPLLEPRRLADHVDRYRTTTRFLVSTLATLSGLALLVLMIGGLGVAGVEAAARLRELAIRQAVGSTQSQLLACLLRRPFAAVAAGATLGALAALGLDRGLAHLAIPVARATWADLVLGATLVAAFTLLATCIRFRQATHTSPAELLRR